MIDAMGIVNFEDNSVNIRGLSLYRTTPAMSFLGRYRIIDFVLSNMVNSGIDQIQVLVRDKPRSIADHLGSGTQYNINFKHGYLRLLYPDHQALNDVYFHDVFLLKENMQYLEESHRKYVVISPSYMISTIDYSEVLEEHERTGADVTCVYTRTSEADKTFMGCKTVTMDDNRRIIDIRTNMGVDRYENILMESYVMKKDLFITLLKEAGKVSPLFSLLDIIRDSLNKLNVKGYEYRGYVKCINSLEEYYDANIEMIDVRKARSLFRPGWPIYTKTNDSAPAFYTHNAQVKNCLIANGCVINGYLENCILGRGVKVGKGAIIKNALLLPKSSVSADAHVEYAIIDKYGQVDIKKELVGSRDNLIYIKRNDRV